MRRKPSSLLLALGLGCGLIAMVLALLGTPTTSVEAAPNMSVGTPTQPPPPTPEPTDPPPTATTRPTSPPTATTRPTSPPTATPAVATATPRPRHKNDPKPEPTPNLPTATATPEQHVEVSLHKTVDHDTRSTGQTAVYTLIGRNAGPATAYDVVITDDVPSSVEVIDLSSSKGDVVVHGQTVTAYPSVLAPGESVTVKITVRVRANAESGTVINTGVITTSTPDDSGDNSSSATFTIPAISTVQRLPRTTETELPGLLALPAWLPWSLVGGLLTMLGIALRLRGNRQVADALANAATPNTKPARLFAFRLPPSAPVGPPRLGPELLPSAPPAPLPPLTPLDRDDALRDAIEDGIGD